MRLLDLIGSGLRYVAETLNPTRDPNDPRWWADKGGTISTAGVMVTEQAVSQLGAVQAVRFGLSGAMSSLPCMVFERNDTGGRKPQPEHALAKLFSTAPNEFQSPAEFFAEISWHLAYWRNIYCKILPGTGDGYAIGGLEIIHPRRFVKVTQEGGRRYYEFKPAPGSAAAAQNIRLRDDEIWHVRGAPLTEDGLTGEGIWISAREVFGRAIAVHQYGDIWFANSGQTGGTLEHPGTFKDKEEKDRFLDAWRSMSTGANRHRDRLLTHGVKYNPLKVTNAEAQLLETEQRSDTEIFGLWSFPPHRAGRLERSTNNNIEQQSLDFVIYALAPLAIAIEQAAERDLLLDNDKGKLFVEFNFNGLLRGDLRTRYQAYLIGRQGEWLSANDIRRLENMDPRTDPGGDEYRNPMTKDSGATDDETDNDETDNDGTGGEQPGEPEPERRRRAA